MEALYIVYKYSVCVKLSISVRFWKSFTTLEPLWNLLLSARNISCANVLARLCNIKLYSNGFYT